MLSKTQIHRETERHETNADTDAANFQTFSFIFFFFFVISIKKRNSERNEDSDSSWGFYLFSAIHIKMKLLDVSILKSKLPNIYALFSINGYIILT